MKKRNKSKSASKVKPGEKGRVITGKARASYMKVLKLEEDDNGNRICSSGILIPKSDKKTVAKIKATIQDVAKKKFGDKVDIFKSTRLRQPLHDGDDMAADPESAAGKESEGMWVLTAKAYKVPQVVDKHNSRIDDLDELEEICISGYYFYFSITFKAFEVDTPQGKAKGVRVLLNNMMFICEGERLDGGKSAEEDFEDFAVEGDDDDEEWDDED